MGCNCSKISEELKRYHELKGACDLSSLSTIGNYSNLERSVYDSLQGYNNGEYN